MRYVRTLPLDAIVADETIALCRRVADLERLVAEYREDHFQRVDEARKWRNRAERLEAAAREMLKFGEHDGPCSNRDDASGTESCVLHVEAFNARRYALIAALG